jgi:hypothetical protein
MMEAPPPYHEPGSSVNSELIQNIYSKFPALFARELARRGNPTPGAPGHGQGHPQVGGMPGSGHPNLKRELPPQEDGMGPPHPLKRRDTGEGKMVSPDQFAPSSPSINNMNMNMPGTPGMGVGGGMGPPGTPGLDASSIAARRANRDRTISPPHPQGGFPMGGPQGPMGSAQQHQQMGMGHPSMNSGQGGQQMGGMQPGGMGGGGPGGPHNQQNVPPHIQQLLKIMQNPQHPFLQHMHRLVPNFSSLPNNVQMQKMLQVQVGVLFLPLKTTEY